MPVPASEISQTPPDDRAVLVQGRRDLVCPPATAYTLAQSWPGARLRMVEDAGHSAMHPALRAALVRATEEFKAVLRPSP